MNPVAEISIAATIFLASADTDLPLISKADVTFVRTSAATDVIVRETLSIFLPEVSVNESAISLPVATVADVVTVASPTFVDVLFVEAVTSTVVPMAFYSYTDFTI